MAAAIVAKTDVRTEFLGRLKLLLLDLLWDGGTYVTNGTAMTKASMGLKSVLFSQGQAGTCHVVYDDTNEKWIVYGGGEGAHAHDLVFKANAAANAVTMAANSLRNASAGDLTVAGAGADGGVSACAVGTADEYTNDAAISLAVRVMVLGY